MRVCRRIGACRDRATCSASIAIHRSVWTLPCVAAALGGVAQRARQKALGTDRCVCVAGCAVSLHARFAADLRRCRLARRQPAGALAAAAVVCGRAGNRQSVRLAAGATAARARAAGSLAAIHGTFMSQQLWGSTYAIWPLLVLLVAEMLAFLESFHGARRIAMVCAGAGHAHLRHAAGVRRILHGQRRAALLREPA